MLVLNRKFHESLEIVVPPSNTPTTVIVKVISFTRSGRPTEMPPGFGVRVGTDAPSDVNIARSELVHYRTQHLTSSEIRDPLGVADCYPE